MTLICAHRGVSSLAPENTMPAFAKAVEIGADEIELDVHFSSDGKLMVIHDEKLARTTGADGYVGTHTAQELRSLSADAGMDGFSGVQIPYLEEVFELIRPTDLRINIELKNTLFPYPGLEQAVMALVHDMKMEEKVFFSSFNHLGLSILKSIAPEMETGLLYDCGLIRPWDYAKTIAGADALHPVYLNLRYPGFVENSHALGIKVRPWTVDAPEDIQKMLTLGVDSIITNVPQNAMPIRDAFEKKARQ